MYACAWLRTMNMLKIIQLSPVEIIESQIEREQVVRQLMEELVLQQKIALLVSYATHE